MGVKQAWVCGKPLEGARFRGALWFKTTKNPDVSTGPLARLFACSLAPLTHLLAPHCSLCLRAHCAHSFARSLTYSRARGKKADLMAIFSVFFNVLDHSEEVRVIKGD